MPRAGLNPSILTMAAADLADSEGIDAVTVTSLARQVGVSTPSLYAHVGGTQDLRVRVAALAISEIADEVANALAGRAGRDAVEALAYTIRSYARRHPGRYAASRTPLDPETAAASAGPRHAGLLRAVLRGYEITDTAESVHAIRVLSGLIHGVVDLEAAGSFNHSDPPTDTSWLRVVDVLDATLRSWPPVPTAQRSTERGFTATHHERVRHGLEPPRAG
ncbi:TetR/AcrR family transcriptional regulator [Micromonospora ureilytica]|uniref:TetR/AcrR family transcriptional regulator n=1 Tax=Micromonospora ureilytica TaxID=709868 RepID=UPI002E13E533|nr:TetR/AcrR family transcriptional regulator [Micromonospora ureilytica]